MERNLKLAHIVFFLSLFVFLIGVLVKLNAPLVEWDWLYFSAAENWSRGINSVWVSDHPPLYPMFLTLWFWVFGANVFVARLANVFCIFATTLVIYRLAGSFSNREVGLWAAALYLVNPVTIQGATLVAGTDTTLLSLMSVLLVWCIFRVYCNPRNINILTTGLIVALCFWAKVTSALALLAGIFAYVLIYSKTRDRPWVKLILGCILGVGIFLVSWTIVSLILWGKQSWITVLINPWIQLRSKAESGNLLIKMVHSALYGLRIIFWFSPFLLALVGWKIQLIWRARRTESFNYFILFAWVTLFYFLGYAIIGGTAWGFPWYHAAILPWFALLGGIFIQPLAAKLTRRETFVICLLSFALFIVYTILFEDPLLLLNLRLKEVMLFGNLCVFIKNLLFQGFFYLVLPVFAVFSLPKALLNKELTNKLLISLFAGIIISNVSLDFKQAKASYITSYEYGAQGKNEVVRTVLKQINQGDMVLATSEFLYEFRDKEVSYAPWRVWSSVETIFDGVEKLKPKVIIMGLTTHTFEQWRDFIGHEKLQLTLKQRYEVRSIGTYRVWFREKEQ